MTLLNIQVRPDLIQLASSRCLQTPNLCVCFFHVAPDLGDFREVFINLRKGFARAGAVRIQRR